MPGSLRRRRLDVVFRLGTGTFTESGTNEVTLTGRRVSAAIVRAGASAQSMGQMQLRIFGMPLSLMNQLSITGAEPTTQPRNNLCTLLAGDDEAGMSIVYRGTIAEAAAEMQGAPDTAFGVTCFAMLFDQTAPVPPNSYRGGADVATILQGLATLTGLVFENNGVQAQLSNPYLHGTAREQIVQVVQAADIQWNGGDDGILAIWPRGGTRRGVVPLLSPQTGLVGYPSYSSLGVVAQALFNPNINFGALVKIESLLKPACGTWRVMQLEYALESETPNGAWFVRFRAMDPRYAPLSF